MARVVQRRSTPPYLLIVFVFLFLISAILAVIGFMGSGDEKKQNVSLNAQKNELTRENAAVKNDIKELVKVITGKPSPTVAEAVGAAEKAYDDPVVKDITASGRFGLAKELETLAANIADQKKTIDSLNAALAEKDQALGVKDKGLVQQQETHGGNVDELNAKIQELNAALAEEKELRDKAVKEVQDNLDKSREELQDELQDREKRLEESVLELAEKEKKVKRLESEIEKLRGKKEIDVVNKADGQIEKIARNAGICYVNIGKKDRVQPGMTLTVYSKKGVKQDNVKGKLLVTNVGDNFSECKITEEDKNAPLVVGDEVANIAYHPVRKNVFVVKGLFDLQGTGNPTKDGADMVMDVITKAGGIISDEVGYQTDYVVLGEEPIKPSKPDEDAPPAILRAYQKQLRISDEYKKIKEQASALRIPVLNTNRFILLTGYEPEVGPQ